MPPRTARLLIKLIQNNELAAIGAPHWGQWIMPVSRFVPLP